MLKQMRQWWKYYVWKHLLDETWVELQYIPSENKGPNLWDTLRRSFSQFKLTFKRSSRRNFPQMTLYKALTHKFWR